MELTRQRAGAYARGQARARYWEIVRPRRAALCLVAAGWYVAVIGMHILAPSIVGDVFMGALLVVPPWVLSLVLVADPSAAAWSRGAESEDWTSIALRKALSSSSVVVDDVQLARGNADHVVVGPFGVCVVETKWSSKAWATAAGYERIRRAIRQVRGVAASVGNALADGGVPMHVSTVVVLWGGDVDRWAAGSHVRTVDGTTVVAGPHVAEWVARDLTERARTPAQIGAIEQVLRAR
jgi:Nuclease-related domain